MSPRVKSAIASVMSTAVDFGTLTGLVELARVDYRVATAIGTLVGAATNFTLNRQWAFDARSGRTPLQIVRFVPVQIGSSILHTLGVWAMTAAGAPYLASKTVVAVAVYLAWNYPLNRYFVFSHGTSADTSPPHA